MINKIIHTRVMPEAAETAFAVDAYVKRLFVPQPSGMYNIKLRGY
jgi:hypothetical protein